MPRKRGTLEATLLPENVCPVCASRREADRQYLEGLADWELNVLTHLLGASQLEGRRRPPETTAGRVLALLAEARDSPDEVLDGLVRAIAELKAVRNDPATKSAFMDGLWLAAAGGNASRL